MRIGLSIAVLASLAGASASFAATKDVTVDSSNNWIGFMAVRELPANGGGFAFGSNWGVGDLDAGFTGSNAFVTPNTNIARDVPRTDGFWWQGDGSANKEMTASFFVEEINTIPVGDTLTFSGIVLSNTLVAPYTSVAFIKELDPNNGYALVNITTVPLTSGVFSISQESVFGLVLQYGFETVGPQSTIGDKALSQATFGKAVISPIPEPGVGLLGLTGAGLFLRRRRA